MTTAIVDVRTLAQWFEQDRSMIILDARALLGDKQAGRALWAQAHIPGAHHADMDRDLAAPPSSDGGRHPLPAAADFAARLRAWGITPAHDVVIYDDSGARMAAARAWWMLTWAGHPAVHVLDGGWQAWLSSGKPSNAETPPATPSDWAPHFDPEMIADARDVARGDALLLDARPSERYRGDSEPIDAKAGHIPGAMNIPGTTLLDAENRFLDVSALRNELPRAEGIIAYCGSGVSACQLILAYACLGRPLPRLYPGSWSAWSRDPARPVETGPGKAAQR